MTYNIGTVDKLIRIIIGIGMILTGIILKNVNGLIGIIPLVTGICGYSPTYSALRISTRKIELSEEETGK